MSKLKRIGMGVSKKHIPSIKKELSQQGYKGLTSRKTKSGYYNLFYKSRKKIPKRRGNPIKKANKLY